MTHAKKEESMRERESRSGSHALRGALAALVAAGLWLAAPAGLAAQQEGGGTMTADDSVTVRAAIVTTGVQDRTPVDTLQVVNLTEDVTTVYCWSHIAGAEGETSVAHVWYHGDEEMARVELRVASPSWRTWSSKQIIPTWTGDWRVEIESADGEVLKTVPFTVREEMGMEEGGGTGG